MRTRNRAGELGAAGAPDLISSSGVMKVVHDVDGAGRAMHGSEQGLASNFPGRGRVGQENCKRPLAPER